MFEALLPQSRQQVAPETLELLGHQASKLFQTKGIPLNSAISQIIANRPELEKEHVKRIVEFANTVTFQERFQNSEDKNVHFEIADPGVVIRDMMDGGSPAHDGKSVSSDISDYGKIPSHGSDERDDALSSAFGVNSSDLQKTASIDNYDYPSNAVENLYDSHSNLLASKDELIHQHNSAQHRLNDEKNRFYNEVKDQVISPDGAGMGGVVSALEKVASLSEINSLLYPVVCDFVEERITSSVDLMASLEKTAGRYVNPNHPILSSATSILKIANEMAIYEVAINDLNKLIEKTSGAITTAVKKALNHKGKVPPAVRQRFSK